MTTESETNSDENLDDESTYASFSLIPDGGGATVQRDSQLDQADSSGIRRREELRRAWSRFTRSKLSIVGLLLIGVVIFTSVFAPFVAPFPEDAGKETHFSQRFESPSLEHPFGTDSIGRDIFSRVIFGSRIALMLGFIVITVAVGIGVPLGLVAGFIGGWIDTVIMRISDIFLSLPPLVLVLAVTFALNQKSIETAILGITVVWWPWYTRIVRGEVLSVKEEEFVEAGRAIGMSDLRITFREILPNVFTPILVKGTLDLGFAILVGTALSFLGVGAQAPTPDWGVMVARGRQHLPEFWWMSFFPGVAILITVLGFNLLGDGLRDVLDVEVESSR